MTRSKFWAHPPSLCAPFYYVACRCLRPTNRRSLFLTMPPPLLLGM
jgi:hypothetical protein